ncbi:MAG: hypothetical protein ABFC96_05390 [Thermoguttaceae bacterium]
MKAARLLLFCCTVLPIQTLPALAEAERAVQVALPPDADGVVRNIAKLLGDQISRRCDAKVVAAGKAQLTVQLAVEPGIGTEGFRISEGPGDSIRIVGNDPLGLLYGVGKFLRTSRYDEGGFTPSRWRGRSVPECSYRAIYAATHFMNFYEAAPIDDVRQYVQELGLWGANTLVLHFPTWQFDGFDDPKALKNLQRINDLFRAAKAVGLRVGLIQCPNQGFAKAPASIRAAKYPDGLGRRGTLGVNCCPSTPAGHAYLAKLYGQLFDQFKDTGLDGLVSCPYDEGGGGCPECWPWGARGYPRLSRDLAMAARKTYPQLKVVLSTWVYDTPPAGEWEGLAAFLKNDRAWLDYVMADAHEDFPAFPLKHGVPGGRPLVNFPEISMWGRSPWGGYGANPLPGRLERLWRQTGGKLSGGLPYSEGIYEDINKAICLQLYWDPQRSAAETVREYIAFEYSPDAVDELLAAVRLLETTWKDGRLAADCEEAHRLAVQAEKKLTPQAKAAWRWRIFLLRTVIDSERYRRGGKVKGPVLKAAFDELTRIYHAGQSFDWVRPPVVVP